MISSLVIFVANKTSLQPFCYEHQWLNCRKHNCYEKVVPRRYKCAFPLWTGMLTRAAPKIDAPVTSGSLPFTSYPEFMEVVHFLFFFLCTCMWCVCTCLCMCKHLCAGQRLMLGVLLVTPCPYSMRQGLSVEPRVHLYWSSQLAFSREPIPATQMLKYRQASTPDWHWCGYWNRPPHIASIYMGAELQTLISISTQWVRYLSAESSPQPQYSVFSKNLSNLFFIIGFWNIYTNIL